MEELIEVTMEELISYSKQKEVPVVTIIDDITKKENNYVYKIANSLNLLVVLINNSKKIAIIDNEEIATKIAKDLKRKSQVMYYDFVRRTYRGIKLYALTGHTKEWITLRDNGYIVKAYDENGNKTEEWIDTDIKYVEPKLLNNLHLSIYRVTAGIKGKIHSANIEILIHSRHNFLNEGIYNENRNCYYPKNTNEYKDIAEYNKLEKLFQKWGFKSL